LCLKLEENWHFFNFGSILSYLQPI
jgi:hypothetical protein